MDQPIGSSSNRNLELGHLSGLLAFHLRTLNNALKHQYARASDAERTNSGLPTALGLISANPGVSQTALAREAGVSKMRMVSILDELEALGWVERRMRTDDRRSRALYATPNGEAALLRFMERAELNEEDLRAAFGPERMNHLLTLLRFATYVLRKSQTEAKIEDEA